MRFLVVAVALAASLCVPIQSSPARPAFVHRSGVPSQPTPRFALATGSGLPPVASTASPTAVPPPSATPSASKAPTVTDAATFAVWVELQRWAKVEGCEEPVTGWTTEGSVYSGGLGISDVNWRAYGGLAFAPNGGLATPEQQIEVAERIQPDPPDQHGCTGSW